jgi:hypothetical protein
VRLVDHHPVLHPVLWRYGPVALNPHPADKYGPCLHT